MIGQTISHYRILEKIGEGGMGVVYKAEDTRLKRMVALKFLPPHLSASEQDKARFIQEAQAAAALNHPNVCSVIDISEHDGTMFIVMEFVDGQTLREKVRAVGAIHVADPHRVESSTAKGAGSPLPMKQAIDIGIQIADGVAAAHEKGIVHRDIKPENIMIRKDGICQIMDFGLAKLRATGSKIIRLTKESSTVGTVGYMSPEQVQGQDADHRSDIFSFGVLLYELFTGQLPFKGMHETALMYEIVNIDAAPMSTVKPDLDPSLDSIVLDCLEKDPRERCQSVAEVARDLRRIKRESSRQRASRVSTTRVPLRQDELVGISETLADMPHVQPSRNKISLLWGGVIFIVALMIGASLTRLISPKTAVSTLPVTRFVLPFEHTDPADGLTSFVLSPDGSRLAYTIGRGPNQQLFIRDMDRLDPQPVPNTKGLDIGQLFFPPDGRWLGFFSRGRMNKISLSGGTPITISDVQGGAASWGDGGTIVYQRDWGSHLWIVNSDANSTTRPLTSLKVDKGERAHILPHVLPGAKSALFTIWTGGTFEEADIAVVDLASGEHRVVLHGGCDARYVNSGHLVYARGSTIMGVPFDTQSMKAIGEPLPVIDNVRFAGDNGASFLSLTENGTVAYVTGGIQYSPTVIKLFDGSGKSRQISFKEKSFGNPIFSPDGKKLGVTIFGSTYHIGVYDLQRDILTQLTFSADNWRPAWASDGSHITYSSNLTGSYQVYTVSADGSDTPEKLFDRGGNPYPSSWSPDGSFLAFEVSGKETKGDIWIYSKNGESTMRPFVQGEASEQSPRISPDGRWIAYVSDESGEDGVYVQPFPSGSGKWRVSNGRGYSPRWHPGGKRVYFARGDEIFATSISVVSRQTGASITVGSEERVMTVEGLTDYDVSSDGKSIVTAQQGVGSLPDKLTIVLNWFEELKTKIARSH